MSRPVSSLAKVEFKVEVHNELKRIQTSSAETFVSHALGTDGARVFSLF